MFATTLFTFTYQQMHQDPNVDNDADAANDADAEHIDAPRKSAVKKAPKLPYDRVHVRQRELRVETPRVDQKKKRAAEKAVKESRTEKSAMT
jgi:hypothetical protein